MMMNLHPDLWAQGCALCRTALEASPEGQAIAGGLARGILLLLILPYMLAAILGFMMYRAYRIRDKLRSLEPSSTALCADMTMEPNAPVHKPLN
jgi:hypothetical protein